MGRWLDPAAIERLAADPAQRMRVPEIGSIDFTRPFVPEAYTQLYYTPLCRACTRAPAALQPALRDRINEYIMMLEADLVSACSRRSADTRTWLRCDAGAVSGDDDRGRETPYRCFLALNRLCRPDLFRARNSFSDLPWPTRALFARSAVPGRLAFALWY